MSRPSRPSTPRPRPSPRPSPRAKSAPREEPKGKEERNAGKFKTERLRKAPIELVISNNIKVLNRFRWEGVVLEVAMLGDDGALAGLPRRL